MTVASERVAVGERIFGPQGVLAAQFPGYEARRPQMEMADLVEQMLTEGGQALIEAGTGTGKSFAYLVPAIERGERVVVSTESIQLQEQLIRKDLPRLEKMLGRPIKFAIAKGRGNYFCERNTNQFVQDAQSRLMDTEWGQSQLITAEQLLGDFFEDWDGNKATLTRPVPDGLWSDFAGDDSCTGAKCPHAEECAYMKAKALFEDADIIVTNHHYYLLHHYVLERSNGAISLLPDHVHWIADEAHTLPDICQNVYGVEIRQGQPKRFVTKLLRQLKALGLDLDIDWDVPGIEKAADEFFGCFRGALKDEQMWDGPDGFPEAILIDAQQKMIRLVDRLHPIRVGLHRLGAGADDDQRRVLDSLKRNADGLIAGLQSFFEADTLPCPLCVDEFDLGECSKCNNTGRILDPDPPVKYAEVTIHHRDRDGKKHVTLHSKPVETARIFRGIYGELKTAIFTSATLAVSGSFSAISEELGVKALDIETLQAKSPFNYSEQVRGYFPTSIPKAGCTSQLCLPGSCVYHDALADEISRIAEWAGGRTFVLFTANRDLKSVRERLQNALPYPLLCQGDAPKDLLIEQFKSEPSVLLGVRTFWTGVDIPGQMLSAVVLVKFPFPQPEAPLVKARCERIEAKHGPRSSFSRYSLPRVVRDVQQGFGRLIRTNSDRGLFAILDDRWHNKPYARTVERSLPAFPKSNELPTNWSVDDAGIQPRREAAGEAVDRAEALDLPGNVAARLVERVQPERGAAAQPDLPASLGQVDQPAQVGAPVLGLFSSGTQSAAGADLPGVRGTAEPVSERAAGVDGSGVVANPREAEAAGSGAGRDHLRVGAPDQAGAARVAPRWAYLRAWITNQYLPDGCGNLRSVSVGVSDGDRSEARSLFLSLLSQYYRLGARQAYLYEHQDDPEWDALDQRTAKTAKRFNEMQNELIQWAGAPADEWVDLFGEVITASERKAAA